MTEDGFLARLVDSRGDGDMEIEHSLGDDLVAEALASLGWERAAEAYNKARENWWYA